MDKQEIKRINQEFAEKMRKLGIVPDSAPQLSELKSAKLPKSSLVLGRWETESPRNGNDKRLMRYDESLARVKALGMRHPAPAEVMAFLIAGEEGKLNETDKKIAQNMLESYGEWLSIAMKRDNTLMHIYEHPELHWDDAQNKYGWTCLKSRPSKTFNIGSLPSQEWISLKQVSEACPELVTYLYSRPYAQLPARIQGAYIYLPKDGEVRPAGRGVFGNVFDIDFDNYYVGRASRGYVNLPAG